MLVKEKRWYPQWRSGFWLEPLVVEKVIVETEEEGSGHPGMTAVTQCRVSLRDVRVELSSG